METEERILLPLEKLLNNRLAQKLSKLKKLGAPMRVIDLLLHLPISYENIHNILQYQNASLDVYIDQKITIPVTINSSVIESRPRNRFSNKKIYRIATSTKFGHSVGLVFFTMFATQINKLKLGSKHIITGKLTNADWGYQMIHPHIGDSASNATPVDLNSSDESSHTQSAETVPIYGLSKDLSQLQVRQAIVKVFDSLSDIELPEWIGVETMSRYNLPGFLQSLRIIHNPQESTEALRNLAIQRLILDELLASQMALQCARSKTKGFGGRVIESAGLLIEQLKSSLGFALTQSQEAVIDEIMADQKRDTAMFRLLQGDVGSGKTVVALCAMLNAIESGRKAVFMVPTTILARQHYQWITNITAAMNINVAMLTGASSKKERRKILEDVALGALDILVGTHALINEQLTLSHFGIIVIDEQHRFGVHQRASLFHNSGCADVLMMTATPIPRTLAMAQYGDVTVSIISEKPSDRQYIDTRMMSLSRLGDLVERLRRILDDNERVYWVCSCITESNNHDLTAVTMRYRYLHEYFSDIVGFLHGRMSEEARAEIIDRFINKDIKILVSTTVIEIGIDVADATIMVIEQAERFGLAQLHQLRGRVGRSHRKSYCFLLYSDKISDSAKKRLRTMRESNDGFYISEQDLALRGSGSILGVKQSGVHDFKLADPMRDRQWVSIAQAEAKSIIWVDPDLHSARGQALRILMKVFDYEYTKQLIRG